MRILCNIIWIFFITINFVKIDLSVEMVYFKEHGNNGYYIL